MRFPIVIFLMFFAQGIFAQDLGYAKKLIKMLASPEFHGRGYVSHGDRKAGVLIRREMNRAGLKSFDGLTYFQPFEIMANTFPKTPLFEIDGKTFIAGEDYLVVPSSGPGAGTFPVLVFDESIYKDSAALVRFFKNDHSNEVVIMDFAFEKEKEIRDVLKGFVRSNSFGAKAIVELTAKPPIFTPSTFVQNFPSFQVHKEKWPKDAKELKFKVKNKFYSNYETNNVIGYLKGKSDTTIFITAHYDHIGRIGKEAYFPGANDNASGTAMLLDLARHFGEKGKELKYSYVFVAFSGEESGLLGSFHFVQNPIVPLEEIKVVINLDMVGSGDEGITVVNGAVYKSDFELMKTINKRLDLLPEIVARGKAANSDHYPFSEKGVKAFFIYTRGNYKEYHNIYDKFEALPLTEYEDLFRLIVNYLEAQ